MICKFCIKQRHDYCLNIGKASDTWCNCQHRVTCEEKKKKKKVVFQPYTQINNDKVPDITLRNIHTGFKE